MQTFLIILIALAALAAVVALIRGIVHFLKQTEADLKGEQPSQSALSQNKAMQARIGFQALAVVLIVLLGMFAAGR
jgi:hypothetical protein